jgi:hypothetical protein
MLCEGLLKIAIYFLNPNLFIEEHFISGELPTTVIGTGRV